MIQTDTQTFQEVANAIAQRIVVASSTSDAAYINLPIRYPGGSSVVVRIARVYGFVGDPEKYAVTDCALGYEEAAAMGVGTIYARHASQIADRLGIAFEQHAFTVESVAREQLAGAAVTIANCSLEAVTVAAQRVEETQQEAESDLLYKRLVTVFTPKNVARNAEVIGASSTPWQVHNLVRTDQHETIFEAVSAHHLSIYAANTKFRDIAELESAPSRVAVVKKKSELKTLLAVLAQAATVIERDTTTDTLRRLAANGHSPPIGF